MSRGLAGMRAAAMVYSAPIGDAKIVDAGCRQ